MTDPGAVTEITVSTGDRLRVAGDAVDIERQLLGAARGSLMEFAWVVDARTGERVAVNPEYVVALRATHA